MTVFRVQPPKKTNPSKPLEGSDRFVAGKMKEIPLTVKINEQKKNTINKIKKAKRHIHIFCGFLSLNFKVNLTY